MDELFFGFELEFISPISLNKMFLQLKETLPNFNFRLKYSPVLSAPKIWGIGYDLSDENCLEIRSPVYKGSIPTIFKDILKVLKTMNCKVSHKCGIHVHISGETKMKMKNNVEEKYKPNIFRLKRWELNRRIYRIIGDNHLEVRLFNSSFNFRHLCRAIKLSKNLYSGLPEGVR